MNLVPINSNAFINLNSDQLSNLPNPDYSNNSNSIEQIRDQAQQRIEWNQIIYREWREVNDKWYFVY